MALYKSVYYYYYSFEDSIPSANPDISVGHPKIKMGYVILATTCSGALTVFHSQLGLAMDNLNTNFEVFNPVDCEDRKGGEQRTKLGTASMEIRQLRGTVSSVCQSAYRRMECRQSRDNHFKGLTPALCSGKTTSAAALPSA